MRRRNMSPLRVVMNELGRYRINCLISDRMIGYREGEL